MAYVNNFQHDIFVSYAHDDNAAVREERRPWVDGFIADLKAELNRSVGKNAYDLWDDGRIRGNEELDDEILGRVRGTAILILIWSEAYARSVWCRNELKTFVSLIREKDPSSALSSVFVVVTTNEAEEARRDQFNSAGYTFWYETSRPKAIWRAHKDASHEEGKTVYANAMAQLSQDLKIKLEELHFKNAQSSQITVEAPAQKKVYLAKVAFGSDLQERRADLYEHFRRSGIQPFPETFEDYPASPEAFREKMMADLDGCDAFIQLLNTDFADRNNFDLKDGWAGLQRACAVECGIEIFQWYDAQDTSLRDIEDDRYRALLEAWEGEGTLRVETIVAFKDSVTEVLLKPKGKKKEEGPNRQIFISVDNRFDGQFSQELEEALADMGIDVALPPPTNDIDVRDNLTNEEIRGSDGVIVVFGNIPPEWVYQQLGTCRKVRADDPLNHRLALCLAPPPPPPDPDEKRGLVNRTLHNMQLLKCQQGLDRNALQEFLNSL